MFGLLSFNLFYAKYLCPIIHLFHSISFEQSKISLIVVPQDGALVHPVDPAGGQRRRAGLPVPLVERGRSRSRRRRKRKSSRIGNRVVSGRVGSAKLRLQSVHRITPEAVATVETSKNLF